MTEPEVRQAVAELLRRLPGENEGPVLEASLCEGMGLDREQAEFVGQMLITLLNAFGVLAVEDHRVKAAHISSSLFLSSLAEHVETGTAVLGNWERARIGDPPYLNHKILTGPQFLYLVERQRAHMNPGARPLRQVRVAQVLVTARLRGQGVSCLVMYDSAANQYQLPGGRMRSADPTIRDVAIRELEEELPRFVFDADKDQLMDMGTAEITQLSRTLGVLTRYEITFFHFRSSRPHLLVGPDARWVGSETLLKEGARVNQASLNMSGLRELCRTMPQAFQVLPLSLQAVQRRTLRDIVRDRPWEFYGILIGVLGIIISVILFFLE
ncbi:hypothetical protein ACFPOI_34455 [Nonomuraea angiospora]|uniref:Nudix hydrolase domain-containing protein n=1 Tax=Nonomuraea angiospora TaxID=46172 RepID=A0ABR9LUH1_9ACTN|nr:NUDIX hydrolase [Nonomuraea angiospora]MBE1583947.1 hypothetical protein [Nonomuraea angiospora]